jgi:hypothetical protein
VGQSLTSASCFGAHDQRRPVSGIFSSFLNASSAAIRNRSAASGLCSYR